jgi:hypothetical protein
MNPKTAKVLPWALACAALVAVLALVEPRSMRAQFSSQSSWIPASGVGGGANAVTLAVPNVVALSDLLGVPLRFLPTNINAAGATTINPTSLGAVAVKRNSAGSLVPVAGGDLSTGVMVEVVYDGTQFVQTNPATGTAPVGSEISVTAGTAAIAGYLIENGTCVSQTTYSALFAFYGNTDVWSPGSTGGACAAGQFHLPFANGRSAVAYDTQGGVTAGKLTNAGSGCAATAVGVLCSQENRQIGQTNLPNVNFTVTDPRTWSFATNQTAAGSDTTTAPAAATPTGAVFAGRIQVSAGTPTAASGGAGTALVTIDPLYTVLKMVKY